MRCGANITNLAKQVGIVQSRYRYVNKVAIPDRTIVCMACHVRYARTTLGIEEDA